MYVMLFGISSTILSTGQPCARPGGHDTRLRYAPTDDNVAVSVRTNDARSSRGSDMMTPPPAQTRFLPSGAEQVCAVWHPPAPAGRVTRAVILCPPFGWDEVCSYRSRRDWAQQLATAGYSTLRVSFPATGDSSGDPLQPGRLRGLDATPSAPGATGCGRPAR